RRRHTRWPRDWSSDVCSSDLSLVIASHEPDAGGELVAVTSEQAGWRDLCFAARRLPAGGCFDGATGASELALVLLGGRATVESKIGRASCRERGWVGGGGVGV